jgi:hypothetical protein
MAVVTTHHTQGVTDLKFFVKLFRIDWTERRVRRWYILDIGRVRIWIDRVLLSPRIRQSALRRARVVVTEGTSVGCVQPILSEAKGWVAVRIPNIGTFTRVVWWR